MLYTVVVEPLDRRHIPHKTGVYIMRDAAGEILYIGKANDLAKRVAQYFNPNKTDAMDQSLVPLIRPSLISRETFTRAMSSASSRSTYVKLGNRTKTLPANA
jgi:predicted GIY-YIG superfamily endonuclease